ncbi:MAG TPA: polysaccharide biosynthesis C-terminal domain-containing protein, partial [Puia sp.]|nr:polysaccharide biosynthesis C-terminal domain-containing protein [Puia sp.]
AGGLWKMTALTFIPGQLLITFFMALFYSKESAGLPNMILTAVNIVLIAAAGSSGYLTLYFTGILLQGVIMAIVFLLKYGKDKQQGLPDQALLKKLFHFSLIALVANIAFFLVYRVDYWWVKHYCTPDELGNYIQVSRLGQMILVLPGLLAGAVFPGTALGKGQHMPDHLARMSCIAVPLFLSLFVLAALSGRRLFPMLFGRSFDKMYVPFLVILPGIFFLSLLALLSAWFGGLRRPGVNAAGALAGLLVIITGDLLFIPRFGIIAAAAASTAGYFTCLLWSLLAFRKESRIGLGSLWIIKKDDWRWLKRQILLKR